MDLRPYALVSAPKFDVRVCSRPNAGGRNPMPTTGPSPDKPWMGRRVYDFLFRFYGPANIGTFDPSVETRPADAKFACPSCGFPMDEHEYQQSAGRKRMTCPGPPLHPPGGGTLTR